MIKLVLFDFDDTLSQTFQQVFNLENIVLREMDLPPYTKQSLRETWGPPRDEAIKIRVPGIDVRDFMNRYYALAKSKASQGLLDPVSKQNLATIKELRRQNRQVGILTSRSEEETNHLISEPHTLAKLVDRIYHTGVTKFRKPDGRVFNVVFKETGIKPQDIVYVGDTPDDALASQRAGINFIATLENGLRTQDDFNKVYVGAFIDTIPEVLQTLEILD